MALLRDIEPLFVAARIFGCTPHRITDKDLLITKWGLFYSGVLGLIFLYGCIAGIYFISVDGMDMKMLFLTAFRTIMSFICFFTDAVLTMLWNNKLQNSMTHLHNFDVSTRFNQKTNLTIVYRCRFALSTVVLFWSLVGYISYICENSWPLFTGISYGLVNAAISMQIFKFIGFLTLLYQRFEHLEKLILLEGNNYVSHTSYFVQNSKRIQIHDVWWLHYRLINSAEQINSVYTIQLLFWITTLFLNTLSRIYTLTGDKGDLDMFKIRESMSVIASISNLLIITIVCHFTALQGNRIGSTMFSPHVALIRKRTYIENNVEVGMYFHLRKLHFSAGAGFIRIDLPLLLSIGAAMTTYLVILHALNSG